MKHRKIAPGLFSALLDIEERGALALTVRARSLSVAHATGSQKEPSVPVFVRCKEKANLDELAKSKIVVNESNGIVRTAFVPIRAIGQLSEHKDVQRISPWRKLRPRLDVALPAVHVPQFRTRAGASGAGVVVGIVDSGIDPNHPSFTGRILRIW